MCLYSLYAGTAKPLKLSHYIIGPYPPPRGSFLVYSKQNSSKKILHSFCPHFPQCSVVLCGHHKGLNTLLPVRRGRKDGRDYKGRPVARDTPFLSVGHRGKYRAASKSTHQKFGYFLSIFLQAVSADITKNSAVGNILQYLNHEY